MNKISGIAALLSLVVVVLSGCGDDPQMSENPQKAEEKSTAYSDLDDKGVLLTVDGINLTKEEIERRLELTFALLRVRLGCGPPLER